MAELIIVDDEPDVRELVQDCLGPHGHSVRAAADAASFRAMVNERMPDLAVLDINMPGEDGLSLARWCRERLGIGVVMLTAAGDVLDRVLGLEIGADDYLVKPFAPAELVARIDAILRRRRPRPRLAEGHVMVGRFDYAPATGRLVAEDGTDQRLSSTERELLQAFLDHPRQVLSRDRLMDLAPARDEEAFDRSIDNRVTRLRRKLERDPAKPDLIKTVRGGGYLYLPAGDAAEPDRA